MKKKVVFSLTEPSYSAPEMNVLDLSTENVVCQSYNAYGLQDFDEASGTLVDETEEWGF